MKWDLVVESPKALPVSKAFLKRFLQFVENALTMRKIPPQGLAKKKLLTAFVSSKRSLSLNKQFLKKSHPADVLSFASSEPNSLGELALCGAKIRAQAKAKGYSCEEWTAYMILHGFLHLLGYTHEQGGSSARIMFKIQDEIFEEWRKSRTESKL